MGGVKAAPEATESPKSRLVNGKGGVGTAGLGAEGASPPKPVTAENGWEEV